MAFTRRDFVEALAGTTVLLGLPACGGGGGGGSGSGPGFGGGCGASGTAIGGNHASPNAHTLTVPAADLRAGADRTYTTGGTADHVHDLTFTAADLLALANGSAVTKTSSLAGSANFPAHTHPVTATCP
jgi:hypothetical protein